VILTSTDTNVHFKFKPKKNLTLIMSGKYVLHLLEHKYKFMGQIILKQIICMWYNY
jgi:hypothetical protein